MNVFNIYTRLLSDEELAHKIVPFGDQVATPEILSNI
jgi:hypothetical protein